MAGRAGALWDASHARLQAALNEAPEGPHEWRIGGDTILAARWGHRTSFDIDVTVGRNTNLSELRTGAGGHMEALARELRGEIVDEERSPTNRLRVRFEKHESLKDCSRARGVDRTSELSGLRARWSWRQSEESRHVDRTSELSGLRAGRCSRPLWCSDSGVSSGAIVTRRPVGFGRPHRFVELGARARAIRSLDYRSLMWTTVSGLVDTNVGKEAVCV